MAMSRGAYGEQLACAYLQAKGYVIVARNYRSQWGEIDIIAQQDDGIAFVEVKLRKNAKFARAKEYVTLPKQKKLSITAALWLQETKSKLHCRFDVIEIYLPEGAIQPSEINHLENAFDACYP